MNEWQVIEQEFKKAFVNYAEHKKANHKLQKLRIKDGNVNAYITRLAQLVHWGGQNMNKPELLCLFGQGLPMTLANECLELNDPNIFNKWVQAA